MAGNNPIVGGNGGDIFSAYGPSKSPVHTIDAWGDHGFDWATAFYIVKGVQLTFADGVKSAVFGTASGDHQSFTFNNGEKVKEMTIHASGRVDRIEITTNQSRSFAIGGSGGVPFSCHVGNGILLGFEGRSAGDVDAIGAAFQT
ncbi:hypothetical protein ASPZODRAFT_25537 [Penicilliopsis zonata CBS 506.65]|uniref:Jacalin-type lectin domain-containing protein n=1 Tax=Penicilliopsis zonata CBS 506.65 TaxID=1073090 RepID=A0A1L9SGU9_9EURO|nr:hypothetical protein ASPZODRAFT_25537 [Penicilliopsis zonata CBS 506.65]OJJ46411.1 hypothetical protein ASPZODRAFT_25537 [Penicilliopsis zonata CBS 506.65]